MFICLECSVKYDITWPIDLCLKSWGPCEECHHLKECYDVPHNRYRKKDEKGKEFNPTRR